MAPDHDKKKKHSVYIIIILWPVIPLTMNNREEENYIISFFVFTYRIFVYEYV